MNKRYCRYIVLLLLFSLVTLFFASCSSSQKYCSTNIADRDHVKLIEQYMAEQGDAKGDYMVIERYLQKDWLPDISMIPDGGPDVFPEDEVQRLGGLHYNVYMHDGEEKKSWSFSVKEGVLCEEETTSAQERALAIIDKGTYRIEWMIGLYGRAYDWEIKAIYLFENEENDAKFILYDTTTAGRYIVFLPGSEYGDKVYFMPLYAFSTIAEDVIFGERVGTYVERIMENCTAALAPYDCTQKINDELGISTPAA